LLESFFYGRIQRNTPFRLGFVSTDKQMFVFQVGQLQTGEFADADAGLKKQFNDSGQAGIIADGITQGPIFHFGKDTGRFDAETRVADGDGGIVIDNFDGGQVAEKSLDGVKLARNRLSGVFFVFEQISFKGLNLFSSDRRSLGDLSVGEKPAKLGEVVTVC